MFGKTWLILFLFLAACAQPKYEVAREAVATGESGQGPKADCSRQFRATGYCLSWAWEELPSSTKPGSLLFKIYRPNLFDRSPVELDFSPLPQLILWMPSMGHGSSPTTVTRLDVGTFRAANVFFVMPGEWDLRFQFEESGAQDEAIVAITVN